MSAKTLTLAKSLHTVSVLVNVARLLMQQNPTLDAFHAVDGALCALGYRCQNEPAASDPYGLAARAVAMLSKGAQS